VSADDFEQPVAASEYGRQRREAWLAGLRANSEMMSQAAMAAHQPDHNEITRSTHGIFGSATGQQMAASTRARPARVGEDYGGRDLVPLGGTVDPAAYLCAPAPPQRDLRQVHAPGGHQPGHSPLWAYMNGGRD